MRFAVFVKATPESEAGQMPDESMLNEMGKFNAELLKAGVLLAGEGLKASAHGKRMTFVGGKPSVIDGPFTESKELVAGFWMLQAASMDEIVGWLRRAPSHPGFELEIRPVFEPEDFAYAPDALAEETKLREQLERGKQR
jgi:hypothetical protein